MIELRRLVPDDWPELRRVRLTALGSDPGNFFRSLEEEPEQPEAHWRSLLANPDGALFGLFGNGALIGITSVYKDRDDVTGKTAGLGMTWLAPAYRGQGLARRFYAARLDWARARGFARVAVSHREGNEPSRRAMLAHGFTRTGATPHQWPDGSIADDVRYELRLGLR